MSIKTEYLIKFLNVFFFLGYSCNGLFGCIVSKIFALEDISATSAEQYSLIFNKIIKDIPTLFPVFCLIDKLYESYIYYFMYILFYFRSLRKYIDLFLNGGS